jgi:beta-glucosidase
MVSTNNMPAHYFKQINIPTVQQPYFCGQNALLAHSKAYHLARSLGITAPISFKNNGGYKVPLTNSTEDAVAVQRAWDFNEGWFANPIFIDGEYPEYLKDYVSTFLRPLTTEEKKTIQGTADFFSHDAYTASFYMAPDDGIDSCLQNRSNPLFPSCVNTTFMYSEDEGGWNIGPAADPYTAWLVKATDWLPRFLHYIQDTWKPRGGIAVTEFGFTEPFESKKTSLADIRSDIIRTTYYQDYLEGMLIAISEGVDVIGCLAWSILDNLEWTSGFNVRFGMQYVNFTTQERHFKASFFHYVNIFQTYQEK